MKTSQVDILVVPGWSGSGTGHWQSRWARQLKTASVVEQEDWISPDRDQWVARIVAAVETSTRPVVFVAHSLGCIAVAHAGAELAGGASVAGALLAAPADVENADAWPVTRGHSFAERGEDFAPIPTAPLPFPSVLIASTDDPYCAYERAGVLALSWGSVLIEAGACGHINVESGHGPWPEGLMRLGWFLKNLE